jgi:hypothetical protein
MNRDAATDSPLPGPADQRLAFRELGLTLGLHAATRLAQPLLTP